MIREIVVGLATARDDIRTIAPLFDAYRVFYEQASDEEASYEFLLERWQQRETVLFFASIGEKAVGFVQLFPSFSSTRMQRFWILNDLFVEPPSRRSGAGSLLMQRAERHARETGACGLTLSTAVNNLKAQALYTAERYVRDEEFLVFNRYF